MPTDVDPNALTLSLILTAAGVVPAAALITAVVSLLTNFPFVVGHERQAAFLLSLILVVYAYWALPVPLTGVSGFAGFLAWLAIAKGSTAVYDEVKAKPGTIVASISGGS
jgi:hypothetical protein